MVKAKPHSTVTFLVYDEQDTVIPPVDVFALMTP